MMKTSTPAAWLLAGCAAFAAASPATGHAAQGQTEPRPADPLQANAIVPAAPAPAPFAQYRPHASVAVQPGAWRAANEQVNRVGGWRTYAREAQPPAPGGAPAAAPLPSPAASPPNKAPHAAPHAAPIAAPTAAPPQPVQPPAAHKH